MTNENEIVAQYEACKVEGRSKLCPRKGIYKVIAVHQGTCFGKPALMAIANWKPSNESSYTESIFEIQLESLKLNSDSHQAKFFDNDLIVGRELRVNEASLCPQTKSLRLTWSFLPINDNIIEKLNQMLKAGFNINLDDDFGSDDFLNEEEY